MAETDDSFCGGLSLLMGCRRQNSGLWQRQAEFLRPRPQLRGRDKLRRIAE